MSLGTITLDLTVITLRLNTLNCNDNYRFILRDGCIILRDWDDPDGDFDCAVNPLYALCQLESASAEYRNYGMPGIVLG